MSATSGAELPGEYDNDNASVIDIRASADDGATVWWAVCLAVFGRWRRLCRDKCFESLHKRLSVFAGSVLRRCERSVRGEYMRRNWIHSMSFDADDNDRDAADDDGGSGVGLCRGLYS